MKKKKKSKYDLGLIPIKTKKQLKDVQDLIETGNYYITFRGQIVSFEDEIFFSKFDAEGKADSLVQSAQRVYKEADRLADKVEALEIINTLAIMPMRLH